MKLFLLLFITLFFNIIIYSQVYVKSTAVGANNGNSWIDAYTDVQTAINDASIGGEDVWIAAGTYQHGSQMGLRNGVTVYGGFPNTGNPIFGDRNYAANITILSGNNSYRVIYNNGGGIDATAVVDGCTIQDGRVAGQGAGIYLRNCSPSFRNCIISNNNSTGTAGDGAGIYMQNICISSFTNCTIENNTAQDNAGGIQTTYIGCDPTFVNCTINNNHSGDHGGGIYIYQSSPVFDNCNITNNIIDIAARNGGGFYIENTSNPIITNCTITGNQSTNNGGGICSISTTWSNNINANTISNNSIIGGSAFGGGVYIDNSHPNITNNQINNNIAQGTDNTNGRGYGGAIYLNGNDVNPNISGNTISGNTASTIGDGSSCGWGGAIYCNQSIPVLDNNIISNNTATSSGVGLYCGRGGAVYSNIGAINITNNTIDNNTASTTNVSAGTGCGYGGGIYLNRTLINTISNNQITNNNSQTYGGGIYMYQSDPNLISNTIDGNIATGYLINTGYGGGICIYDDTGTGTSPTLTSNIIINNQANDGGNLTSGYGGGVYIRSTVDPIFTNNTIIGNTSSQRGGAIYIRDAGTLPVFNRNNINSNTSADGGAGYIDLACSPEFYNNLIYNNNATNGAGFYFNSTSTGTYLNNVIANNIATINGGGLYCQNSDPRFTNDIFWGNMAASGNNIYLNDGGSDPYFNYCNVEGGNVAFAGGGSGGAYIVARYTNNVELNPQFINDPVGDFHITKPTSPCIGAGNPATIIGDFPVDEDYEANARIIGTIDIGAFETNNNPQFVVSIGPTVDDPGPKTVNMDEDANPTAFSLILHAQDIDNQNITWSVLTQASNGLASIPAPLSVSPPWTSDKAINYTSNADFNGADQFVIQVSDGIFTDQITVDVNIASINDAPVFSSTTITTAKATHLYTYNIVTSDIDADPLNISIVSVVPAALWLNLTDYGDGTALLSGTPSDADIGPYTITLEVDDGVVAVPIQQVFVLNVSDRIIYVPADYLTIQQGINATVNGDKVIVAAGTYNENINFNNKEIEVEGDPANPASVIINGGGNGAVVTFENGEAGITSLNGFTLRNGGGRLGIDDSFSFHAPVSGFYGGGVFCYQSSPLLKNLRIENNILFVNNNHGGSGAGIYIGNNSNVTIEGPNTLIQNNTSTIYRGGGICIDNSNVTIDGIVANGVRIENNNGGNYGGGISVFESILNLTDVRISNNNVDGSNGNGGGVYSIGSTLNQNPITNISGNSATLGNNDLYSF
ncbi:MAG: right-handed parallel beta-helix repeat-containing protein [Bacteroidales bacterium]|nr:right-handed parallel beta-helix repeat-containing protein [Bacteroidales bacterium]